MHRNFPQIGELGQDDELQKYLQILPPNQQSKTFHTHQKAISNQAQFILNSTDNACENERKLEK